MLRIDTVVSQVGAVARSHPQDPALTYDGQTWSYSEMWQRTEAVARGLLGLGLADQEPVGIIGRNEAAYVTTYLGVMRAGCIAVPINTLLDLASIRDSLDLVGVKTIVVGHLPDGIREGLEDSYRLVEMSAPPAGPTVPALPVVTAEATCKIMLTSGSTGRPKGAEHSHASIFHAVTQMASAFPFDRCDRGVVFLPLYTCIPEQVLPTLCSGGSLEILPGFDVDHVADACTRATTFDGIPTVMSRLIEHAPLHKLSKLRWVQFASEPMPVHLLKSWWDLLPGVETHQFYGMTELLNLTIASHAMLQAEPETVGRAFPTSGLVLDPVAGHSDGSGEIQASSPSMMRGYLNDPSATDAALTSSGLLRTGDIGRIDDRGLLFLTGRLKDIIISGGFNVAPAEIESVAFAHGGLAEVMVVGVPSARWGETPVVVAVPKADSTLTAGELLRYCRTELTSFKRPSAAALVASLPTTGIGKGDKATVRRLIETGAIRLVSE